MEQQDLQSVTESSKKSRGTPEADGNEETAGEAESADRGAESRAETGKHDAEKIWTAEEILADEDLWKVTDSSEESSSEHEEEKKGPATSVNAREASAPDKNAASASSAADRAKVN